MNSEYSLIQLLLRSPNKIHQTKRMGVEGKIFKNKNYGLLYDKIFQTYTTFASIPTDEELATYEIEKTTEEISQTIEHLVSFVVNEYNRELLRVPLKEAAVLLMDKGANACLNRLANAAQKTINTSASSSSVSITEMNDAMREQYNDYVQHKGKIIGIPTGFDILDKHTRGLQPGWLSVIAGRNGAYKSWVLAAWVLNAWRSGKNIALFSFEMSTSELRNRINLLGAGISPDKYKVGELDNFEYSKLFESFFEETKSYGNLILNDSVVDMNDIESEIERMNSNFQLDLIAIDSVYRMSSAGESEVSRQKAIANASKNLAIRNKIPIACTVQLNREFAKQNAAEKKSDTTIDGGYFIANTDAWNQDADLILTLHQPDAYKPYNYHNMMVTKFRHGQADIQYILECNAKVPIIHQIDTEEAKARILSLPTKSTMKDEHIIEQGIENTFQAFDEEGNVHELQKV